MNKIYELEQKALEIRGDLLRLCSMESIHIGGDLSVTDIMTALWQAYMRYDITNPKWEGRDRFVLSKGHASAVLSFNQAMIGCFHKEDIFKEYAKDGGRFSMHSCNLINPFIEVSTGSLGHGMPVACGIAQALRLKNNMENRVYTILGDGELSEGSIWEATLSAVKFKLGNLVVIIDNNNLEADGYVDDITALGNIAEKFKVCGFNIIEINGNNMQEVVMALDSLPLPSSTIPTAIVCHTIKGYGVDFMENNPRWHAGRISDIQYSESYKLLEKEFKERWKEAVFH